jgi:hypothetical protein
MNLLAKLDELLDAEWLDWPESHDDASPYDFAVWNGLLFVGRTYRGRIIFAPASIIHGGIADGRFVYTKDPRKRIKTEPPDLSRIELLNGRVEELFTTRNRNLLKSPKWTEDIPRFDKWCFKRDKGYFKNAWQISKRFFHDNRPSKTTGDSFLATWQYGEVGNASPTVKDPAPTREQLWAAARPLDKNKYHQDFRLADGSLHCFPLAVLPWNAHAKHLAWNWKKHWEADRARFDEENARRYRRRLDHSAKGYDDLLRWNGKAKCKFDETYAQASGRVWGERLFGREPKAIIDLLQFGPPSKPGAKP